MKAISIKQPWAELILQGRKTLELRTWRTNHRGTLIVHASQSIDRAACEHFGLKPDTLPRGQLVGAVELVEVIDFTPESFDAARHQHLTAGAWPGDLHGWRLRNPQRLPQPVPMRGRLNLFDVPDDLLPVVENAAPSAESPVRQPSPAPRKRAAPSSKAGSAFELRVTPVAGSPPYALTLCQWPDRAGAAQPAKAVEVARLDGLILLMIGDTLVEALRRCGYKATDLSEQRRAPFRLDEETGIRLALLFLTLRPLSRLDRIDGITSGLIAMPSEEAYYWYSKCTALTGEVNALRALRILLAGE